MFDPAVFDPAVFDTGPSGPVEVWTPVGPISLALPISITALPQEIYDGTAPVAGGGQVQNPAPGYSGRTGAVWRAVVMLDGADVSSITAGEIRIRGQAGAARVAELQLLPPAGLAISIASWTGRELSIDFAARGADGSALYPVRVFTGVVDTPAPDPNTGIISLTCTDDLPGVIAAMTNDDIDALCGGRWSHVVFDPVKSVGWQRAQDRMSTRRADLDLDAWRQPRVTDWHQPVPALTVTPDDYEDGSLQLSVAARDGLVNQVNIEFNYRYPRLKCEGYGVSYSFIGGEMSWRKFVSAGNQILTRAAVESALSSAGAAVSQINWDPIPGPFAEGIGDDQFVWAGSPAADQLCQGFSAVCSFDYFQTAQDQHKITVKCQASIDQVGVREESLSSALEGAYPADESEAKTWLFKTGQNKALTLKDTVQPVAGFTVAKQATLTEETNQAAADAALEVLIGMAKTRIQAGHRRTTVSCVIPLNPAVDGGIGLRIQSPKVDAAGKVSSWEHGLDTDSGRAVTTVTLAVSSLLGVGIDHPETETVAPVPEEEAHKPIPVGAAVQYNYGPDDDHMFSVEFQGVEEAERKLAERVIETSVDAGLIEDLFLVLT